MKPIILTTALIAVAGCTTVANRDPSPAKRDYTHDQTFMREYYDAAVRIAKDKVVKENAFRATLNCELPIKPRLSSGLNNIFIWDAAFCCIWAKDVPAEAGLPVHETLDNLYLLQQEDGFICREHTPDGHPVWNQVHPTSYNPPIIAWAENELLKAGRSDLSRIKVVYPKLVAFHECYKRHLRREDGLYVGDILGGGMDDVPRWPTEIPREKLHEGGGMKFDPAIHVRDGIDPWYREFTSYIIPEHSWNFQAGWIDMSAQMAFDCLNLADLANALGKTNEAKAWIAEHDELARIINEKCWDEEKGLYFDVWAGGFIHRYTVASYWTLIAKVATPERAKRMALALEDPEIFGRPVPVPSLAKCDPEFAPETAYWKGAVWPPTTYMTIRGLREYGMNKLAEKLARKWYNANAQMYVNTGTIWENLSCEQCEHRKNMSGTEFCGWSALAPVSIPLEFGWRQ